MKSIVISTLVVALGMLPDALGLFVARAGDSHPPRITQPISFDTPAADEVCSTLQIFPSDNPWRHKIADWPTHPRSAAIVAAIGREKPLRYNTDMAFVLVPANQPRVPVKLLDYPEESDPGPYPVPDNVPIEGWPVSYSRSDDLRHLTLDDVQRNKTGEDADRHAIVVDPAAGKLFEFYKLQKTDQGWQASCAAIFDLKSNRLRPDGWTSTDAAGLPIFPAIVRYDELKRGEINHALRVTVPRTRRAYVYPATHFASTLIDEKLPRMGERLRLRADFEVAKFSPEVRVILTALKTYGMLVADNGIEWAISCAPDPRIPELHEELRKIKGSDFEVVVPPPDYQPPK
ncbi:MAG: hypothetical protein SFX18_16430 [Pirellulales bacterium]|nr:hypothetical protein [Pirellulales bacterium]